MFAHRAKNCISLLTAADGARGRRNVLGGEPMPKDSAKPNEPSVRHLWDAETLRFIELEE